MRQKRPAPLPRSPGGRKHEQIALTWDGPERGRHWRKRAEGEKRKQAIRALVRRRAGVIYAMLSGGSFYGSSPSAAETSGSPTAGSKPTAF